MSEMEEKLTAIYNAFEPNVPANSQNYIDCKEARGGGALVKKMKRRFLRARNGNIRFLFTGHLGCGKSSELLHLANALEKDSSFFPIYIDFEEYLDKQDTTLEDIFLGIIAEIASRCRQKFSNKFEVKLNEDLYSLTNKLTGIVSDLSVKAEVGLPFNIAKINVEKLKENPSIRGKVRKIIKEDDKKSLFSELNDFIMQIELLLKQNTEFNKLVIIADSLEKIKRFEKEDNDNEDDLISQKRLFIDKAEQLTKIATNVIYTIPLALYRSHYGTQLPNLYSKNVFVLPMVKVHKRGKFNEPFELGQVELKEIIKRRLKIHGISIDEVFEKNDDEDKDALKYLLKYSGGHIRSLVRFIQESSISIDELPIDFKSAKESVREEVRSFAASVDEDCWDKLAKLELSNNQQIPNGDDDYSKMLESLAILEYMNGDEVKTDDDRWYAVNPAIRRTIKFKEALNKSQPKPE